MQLWPFCRSKVEPAAASTVADEFGVPAQAAEAILREPRRSSVIQAARERLTDLSPTDKIELVDRIVLRTALTIAHLPASATYHHTGLWGLLDHSIEVAVRALSASLEVRFSEQQTQDPGLEYDLLPRWRYATFLLGLLHDVGKLVQLVVEGPGGAVWNPFEEPLAAFLIRHSLWPPEASPVEVSWRRGRSLEGHEWHNTFFVSRIITPAVARYLGPVLPLALDQSTSAGVAMAGLIGAADSESVVAERRARLAEDDANGGTRPAVLSRISSVADYFPYALQLAIESGTISLNTLEADAFVGDHYVAMRYPGAILKIMEAIHNRWKDQDGRARHLRLDQTGVKLFVRDLTFRQFLFKDRQSGTWKLKATVELAAAEAKTFLVLVKKEIVEAAAFRLFPGRISLYSIVDQSPIAVDDFSVADVPSGATQPPKAQPAPMTVAKPPSSPVENVHLDPDELLAKLRELVLVGKIKANVPHGPCYVTKDVTYFVWPRAMIAVREALGLPWNPMEERRPYTAALAQLSSVMKDDKGSVVSSIKFRPDAERVCRVVRFDTSTFFQDEADLARVGYWPEGHLITPATPDERVARRMPTQ